MWFLMPQRLIRFGFLAVLTLVLASGSVFAQKNRYFLTPEKTQSEEKKEENSKGSFFKRRLFVTRDKNTKTQVPFLEREKNAPRITQGPSGRVQRNLGIYREVLKINPEKLSMMQKEPQTAQELQLVAAASRMDKVEQLIKMQKNQQERQKQKTLQQVRVSKVPVQSSKSTEPNADKETIYKKPKKSIFPFKLFGNR